MFVLYKWWTKPVVALVLASGAAITSLGLLFAAWQRQACLFSALPRLVAREPITQVALDLGYESPAAFTTMFKKALGVPPSEYVAAHE